LVSHIFFFVKLFFSLAIQTLQEVHSWARGPVQGDTKPWDVVRLDAKEQLLGGRKALDEFNRGNKGEQSKIE
jgi:hypothetical protein